MQHPWPLALTISGTAVIQKEDTCIWDTIRTNPLLFLKQNPKYLIYQSKSQEPEAIVKTCFLREIEKVPSWCIYSTEVPESKKGKPLFPGCLKFSSTQRPLSFLCFLMFTPCQLLVCLTYSWLYLALSLQKAPGLKLCARTEQYLVHLFAENRKFLG